MPKTIPMIFNSNNNDIPRKINGAKINVPNIWINGNHLNFLAILP